MRGEARRAGGRWSRLPRGASSGLWRGWVTFRHGDVRDVPSRARSGAREIRLGAVGAVEYRNKRALSRTPPCGRTAGLAPRSPVLRGSACRRRCGPGGGSVSGDPFVPPERRASFSVRRRQSREAELCGGSENDLKRKCASLSRRASCDGCR